LSFSGSPQRMPSASSADSVGARRAGMAAWQPATPAKRRTTRATPIVRTVPGRIGPTTCGASVGPRSLE